ncbi:hypothetical protein TRIUR3_09468 [Triticum urartu]|uniref:Uncharacterized protein n=1 Tax=Triticum urartu TaxID=4572 RepID=M8AG25_TRIUA|nr:hypothetical protein TRIUR3_09468 [Triticum urartu]
MASERRRETSCSESERCSESSLDMAAPASNASMPSAACGTAGSRKSTGSHEAALCATIGRSTVSFLAEEIIKGKIYIWGARELILSCEITETFSK